MAHADGLLPDIEFRDPSPDARFDWIHRRDGETEIYFISNQSPLDATVDVVFRVAGRQPELWDAVTGNIRDLPDYRDENGRTIVPLTACAAAKLVRGVQQASGRRRRGRIQRENFPDARAAHGGDGTVGGVLRSDVVLSGQRHGRESAVRPVGGLEQAARRWHPLLLRHGDVSDDLRIPSAGSCDRSSIWISAW